MKIVSKIAGTVLPTAMVISVLLLLTVLALGSLWEADFLMFSRHRFEAMQRAHIEAGFTLYREHPEAVIGALDADSTLLLYDSLPHSRIKIDRRPWGLYERVTIYGYDGRIHSSRILGRRSAYSEDVSFFYRNAGTALTLTGKTRLKGQIRIPRRGLIYGRMGSVFFDGEKPPQAMIKDSDTELPDPEDDAVALVAELMERAEENIEIDSGFHSADTIIVGKKIRIKEGFVGALQAFATDSLNIEPGVVLEYPSGLYSETYIGIGDGSEVNGYVIVAPDEEPDPKNANHRQSRLATVRGLLYVRGTAQFQGIVSGCVFLDKAVYYSSRGYYENMIYDATVLENSEMASPLWLSGPSERKEAKWID